MKQANRLIVVLGMHRSGTSAITRGLQALGVDLGNSLMPPLSGNNEKGFWEDLDLYTLTVSLLRHLGHDWHSLALIRRSELEHAELEPFVADAAELLRKKMAGTSTFGIKDPRITRLLPFWDRVFSRLRIEVGYVIALRHPMSVANSLGARDRFESEKSYLLWLEHMVASVLDSVGRPRLVVSYDRLMDRPDEQLRRIALTMGVPFDAASGCFDEYAGSFLEHGLRHSRFDMQDLHVAHGVPQEIVEAYELLERLAADDITIDAPDVGAAFGRFAVYLDKLAPLLGYMTRRDAEIAGLGQALAEREGRIAELDRITTERNGQLAILGQAVADRDGRIVALGQAVADRDGRIVALGQAVADRDGRIVALGQAVADRDSGIVALGQAVADRDGRIVALGQAVADRDGQVASLVGMIEEIHRSIFWRLLAPLRWYVRQHRRLGMLWRVLPYARARTGGMLPLFRFTWRVWRQDGLDGLKSLVRQHIIKTTGTLQPAEPAAPTAAAEPVAESAAYLGEPEILFVSHEASRTGAPVFLLNIARLLKQKLGISCAFLLCSGGELEEQFRALGHTLVLAQRYELDPLALNALRKRDIRLVYSNTATNGQIQQRLKELGYPILCHVHELGYSIERYFGGDNFKAVLATTDFYLAGSGAVADYLIGQRQLPPEKVAVAHPFIDVAANRLAVERSALPLDFPADTLIIGACGTIIWRKGADLFVQVARRVLERTGRSVHFVWLGGPLASGEYHSLRYDAEMMGIAEHLSFTGAVSSHLPYLGQFDIFVLPSREDPFPLVALDAASLGIPIVCFDKAGGTPELVEADAGIVVPYSNVDCMADAIIRLTEDDALRRRFGEAARAKVLARHDIDVGSRPIVDIVKNFVKPSAKEEA